MKTFVSAFLLCALLGVRVSQGAEKPTFDKIHVAYTTITGTFAPVWMAVDGGLFQKQRLDATLLYIPGGARSVMAMVGGNIQFNNHSALTSLEAYVRGSDLVYLASTMNRLDHVLIVQPNIKNVQDLRGKTLGVSALGSMTDFALREALRSIGVSERDVNILAAADSGARMAALGTGHLHGTLVNGSQLLAATRMGYRQLLDFSTVPVDMAVSAVLARRTYVNENPDLTLRYLKAWIEGIYLFKYRREAALPILKKFTRITEPELLEATYGRYVKIFSTQVAPSLEVTKSMLGFVSRMRPVDKDVKLEGFVEPRFVHELERTGFLAELKRQYGER
jgi:NitT/TauT family transport system substrate-binding protein